MYFVLGVEIMRPLHPSHKEAHLPFTPCRLPSTLHLTLLPYAPLKMNLGLIFPNTPLLGNWTTKVFCWLQSITSTFQRISKGRSHSSMPRGFFISVVLTIFLPRCPFILSLWSKCVKCALEFRSAQHHRAWIWWASARKGRERKWGDSVMFLPCLYFYVKCLSVYSFNKWRRNSVL